MGKLNAKKLKEEFDALDDDEKAQVRKAFGVKDDADDEDVLGAVKKFGERLDAIEKAIKASSGKKDGFFAGLFSGE